jgi:multidrug efflux pump subunit AcrB
MPCSSSRFRRRGSCGRVPGHHDRQGWLSNRYETGLSRAIRHPWLVIVGTVVVAAVGTLFFFRLETGFLPEMDEGGYVIDYVTPAGTSLPETDAMLKRVEAILKSDPDVDQFTRRTGLELGLFATEQNTGDFVVRLKPSDQRSRRSEEIISAQRARFAREVPGVEIEFVQLLQDMLGDLEGNPEPVEVKVFGDDLPTLFRISEGLADKLRKIDGLVDIVGPRLGNPELLVRIDSTRAAKAGFTPEQITQQLSAGMLGHVATEVRRGDRLVDLRVRYPDKYRFDPAWVRNFPLTSEAGAVVPLQATAEAELTEGSAQLYREDLKQMLPISGRLEGRDLGSAIADVRAMLEAEHLPVGYTWQIGGQYESQQNSFRSLLVVAALALLLVFGLLVAQFRGFSSAMVIVSAAPLSLVGAFGLLLLTHTPFECLVVHGANPAYWPDRQERDHPCRPRARALGTGRGLARCARPGGRYPVEADSHDHAVHPLRPAPARTGVRSWRGDAAAPGDCGHRGADGLDAGDAGVRAGGDVDDGAAEFGTDAARGRELTQ